MLHFKGSYTEIDLSDSNVTIPDTDGFYQYEKEKSLFPAYHFRLSSYDLALYGQLYLNEGNWKGKEIIPVKWIQESTKPFSITNENVGIAYGMLWRVLYPNAERSNLSFFHTGAGVHMLGVYPGSNLVLVHRVDTESDYNFPMSNIYKMISLVFGSMQE
jgi:CubicO group peptidase (beta-lactamase class C family)